MCQVKHYVSPNILKQLVLSFILKHLDFGNVLLICLPWSTIAPLQHVQNAIWLCGCYVATMFMIQYTDTTSMAVSVMSRPRSWYSTLIQLQWLSVMYRIRFKLALQMYQQLSMLHQRQCLSGQQSVSPSQITIIIIMLHCSDDQNPNSAMQHLLLLDLWSRTVNRSPFVMQTVSSVLSVVLQLTF